MRPRRICCFASVRSFVCLFHAQPSSSCDSSSGVAYTFTFDPSQPPTATLSDVLRPATNLSYAVCYGLPIVKTLYLDVLLDKLQGSWKKTIDSQDSFALPDMEGMYAEEYDAKMPQYRRTAVAWRPDAARGQLFKGWSLLSLNPNPVCLLGILKVEDRCTPPASARFA